MLKIYNTLSHSIEEFSSINPPKVGMYTCGPTVYDFQHIGHMRRYVGDDLLIRVLKFNNFNVKQVMNITDVGHLTSDRDTGEDKMEKGAAKFNLSVWDVAKKFEKQFFDSCALLNIQKPSVVIRATDAIDDQIALVEALERKGFTYVIEGDGVYFDTSKFSEYGKLTGQKAEELKKGARVEFNEKKKNATDFALWKFSPVTPFDSTQAIGSEAQARRGDSAKRRQMEWDSPWGKGFPGWHIECSAMSMRELGPTLDIHTGGIDHIPIHHTNEIAQSEAATDIKPFVKYWVHHNFLHVEGKKMSKSIGNIYTVQEIVEKGYDPFALRYLYLQTHYRQEMNFTWEALDGAQTAFSRLIAEVSTLDEPKIGCAEYEAQFNNAVNDDLNMPKALAVMWEMIKSDYPTSAKAESLFKMDDVLGLNLQEVSKVSRVSKVSKVPEEVQNLVKEREELRKQKRFHLSDQLRNKIKKMGYDIKDEDDGSSTVTSV